MNSDGEPKGGLEKKRRLLIVQSLLFSFSLMVVRLHSVTWMSRLQKQLIIKDMIGNTFVCRWGHQRCLWTTLLVYLV